MLTKLRVGRPSRCRRCCPAAAADARKRMLLSLLLMMNMACTLFRMTPEEALLGATAHAARALGLTEVGVIAQSRTPPTWWLTEGS